MVCFDLITISRRVYKNWTGLTHQKERKEYSLNSLKRCVKSLNSVRHISILKCRPTIECQDETIAWLKQLQLELIK